jgi:hypothetical protein
MMHLLDSVHFKIFSKFEIVLGRSALGYDFLWAKSLAMILRVQILQYRCF